MRLSKSAIVVTMVAVLLLSAVFSSGCSQEKLKSGRVTFKAQDGVTITGDLYLSEKKDAPFIILYHQASYSRGEYVEIAPKLNKLGFNCLAIDQRSGSFVNNIPNETSQDAIRLGKEISYVNAFIDLEGALAYAKDKAKAKNVIVWGSSYSASLVFALGQRYPQDIKGILSFSPGEYFTLNGKSVKEFAKEINSPVFVTSTQNEFMNYKDIYEAIPSAKKVNFLPKTPGEHGSKALWERSEDHQSYWTAVESFLGQFLKK